MFYFFLECPHFNVQNVYVENNAICVNLSRREKIKIFNNINFRHFFFVRFAFRSILFCVNELGLSELLTCAHWAQTIYSLLEKHSTQNQLKFQKKKMPLHRVIVLLRFWWFCFYFQSKLPSIVCNVTEWFPISRYTFFQLLFLFLFYFLFMKLSHGKMYHSVQAAVR